MRLFFEELLIGFELKNFLITLAVLFIIYLAWESTYVRDYRVQPNAVLIIENNRRLLVDIGTSTQHDLRPGTDWTLEPGSADARSSRRPTESATSDNNSTTTRNTDQPESTSNVQQIPEPPPSLELVIEEVHDLASVRQQLNENVYRTLESFEEGITELLEDRTGPQEVIAAMDTQEGLRRRRLGFEQSEIGVEAVAATSPSLPTEVDGIGGGDSIDSQVKADSSSNENNSKPDGDGTVIAEGSEQSAAKQETPSAERSDEFTIKLKYLNDDMKLVKGTPNENIGDFKKRNFTLELSAQKFVRLVFNGHVLQPDSKTLQACGLFDNCVVHCLVHNRNPNAANQNQQQSGRSNLGQENNTSNLNTSAGDTNRSVNDVPLIGDFYNHEEPRGHLMLMYGGIIIVTLSLIGSWYCRIQYHALFSWYSTFVLIIVTILSLIVVPSLISIENNEVQRQPAT